jgi:lysophospholipid acyltransferase (LPLAT)-like uncharacterized protein
MKTLVRHPVVQRSLSSFFSTYLRILYRTLRWKREGQQIADAVWKARETGAILCLWHEAIPISPPSWDQRRAQELRVLISRSSDGEFIAQVMEDLGMPAIRGSRRRENSVGEKGGAPAFRDMVKWVKGGGGVALTPDGPVGPARVMGEGAPTLARMTGAPVLLVGLAIKPCARARSWDRTIIPFPFTRAAMVWDGPLHANRDDDLAALAKDWGDRLTAATLRAEALLER